MLQFGPPWKAVVTLDPDEFAAVLQLQFGPPWKAVVTMPGGWIIYGMEASIRSALEGGCDSARR